MQLLSAASLNLGHSQNGVLGNGLRVDVFFFKIEESAFTSVSQLPDADIKVPHPPQLKKSNRPTPRKQVRVHDSKRHIDGIRQHHEQR